MHTSNYSPPQGNTAASQPDAAGGVRPYSIIHCSRTHYVFNHLEHGSVTCCRTQMALLSAHGLDAMVAFISQNRVRDVIHNFNADGFTSLYPGYMGGRLPSSRWP